MPGKLKITIRQFKNTSNMDKKYADTTWALLEKAIEEIHRKNASGLSFEELYRNAYNMVLHKHGDRLYRGLEELVKRHLRSARDEVAAAHDGQFLSTLNKHWSDHKVSMLMIRDILMYMDRVYVAQNNCLAVYDLGLTHFKEQVVFHERVRDRLRMQLLSAIQLERNNELVDQTLLKSMTSMLVELGLGTKDVYVAEFERFFLRSSTDFYRDESNRLIAVSNCAEYMQKVEQRLYEESLRVHSYLDPGTLKGVRQVLEREMIATHMETLAKMENSGLVAMLRDEKLEDLKRMYDLFGRVEGGHELMRTQMSTYLRDTGKALAEHDDVKAVDYVDSLIQLMDKYDRITTHALGEDSKFVQSVHQAFEYFVNMSRRGAEYISLFIDHKLKKGLKGMTEEEVESVLDKTISVFRFLQEKDLFETYYKQHLAKRLLLGRSVSDDAERQMISKLKTECGYQFTSKFEGMFTDMRLSNDGRDQFNEWLQGRGETIPVDLRVSVLTKGFWPTHEVEECLLPDVLTASCAAFREYYLSVHTGRVLTWQTNMGTAELRATFNGSKKGGVKELSCSTYQMVLLLLFNDQDSLTFDDIAKQTKIQPRDLKRQLAILTSSRSKILLKEPDSKRIEDTDVFSVNTAFSSRSRHVKITAASSQKQSDGETKEVRQKVDEDRNHEIEAAIVRVMKTRKVEEHSKLILEVARMLMHRFPVTSNAIKRRIESLIERDYLERNQDRKMYSYLA